MFLFAPAGAAIFLMTLVMPKLATKFGETTLARAGGLIVSGSLVAMALIPLIGIGGKAISPTLPSTLPFQSPLVLPLMVVAAGIGIGFALANIPSQSVLMDRAPVETRGRIFSALLLLGNVAAIIPLAFLGVLADLYGVNNVVGLVGVLMLVITAIAIRENIAGRSDRSPVQSGSDTNARTTQEAR